MRRFRFLSVLLVLCLMLFPMSVFASNQLTLYGVWQVDVMFDANGGVLTKGVTEAEKALVGQPSGLLVFRTNQQADTGLSAEKEYHAFLEWNTRPDGTGTAIADYGAITGPVTFYAIYYQTDFPYIGDAQVFTAPYTGWYQAQCWGAMGGQDSASQGEYLNKYGGSGAYTSGEVYLNKGDALYVYVGGHGVEQANSQGAGYNGGGAAPAVGSSGSGGGATDIRLVGGVWNDADGLASRVMVAAGGGGGASGGQRYSGHGGGLTSESTTNMEGPVAGAGQTYAGPHGGFGYGGSSPGAGGGGGGGWYGGGCSTSDRHDSSGSGGSSYISGYAGCVTNAKLSFVSPQMVPGSANMPDPDGGMQTGNRDDGYCRIIWLDQT